MCHIFAKNNYPPLNFLIQYTMASKIKHIHRSSSETRMLMQSRALVFDLDLPSTTNVIYKNPMPDDFVAFIPWACKSLQVQIPVKVMKEFQADYVSLEQSKISKRQGKLKSKSTVFTDFMPKSSLIQRASKSREITHSGEELIIKAIYSSNENILVQLKFEYQQIIPRSIFQILGLIIKFYPSLTAISANKGVDQYVVYELSKLLPISNITEVCLDGCNVPQANYYILLDVTCRLKHLSLSRCSIDDEVLKIISSKLHHLEPASKSLIILNLSSNFISDIGAQSLARALRTNRRLSYLNLAGNMLTDLGAISILDVLTEFRMTQEENDTAKARRMAYLRLREKLIIKNARDLSTVADWNKQLTKKAKASPKPTKKKSDLNKDDSITPEKISSQVFEMASFYDKAKVMTIEMMGAFEDPFDKYVTFSCENGERYCVGNYVLAYINLSYNNITQRTLAKVVTVLETQRNYERKPRGLINLKVEGNLFPDECWELTTLEYLLEASFASMHKKLATTSKKNTSISVSSSRRNTPVVNK